MDDDFEMNLIYETLTRCHGAVNTSVWLALLPELCVARIHQNLAVSACLTRRLESLGGDSGASKASNL